MHHSHPPARIQTALTLILSLLLSGKYIRTMQPIKQTNGSIIQIELFMMQIMHFRLASEEVISAMHRGGIEELIRQIRPEGQDVAAQDLRRQRNGQGIGKNMLNGMRILGRQGDRGDEPMMALVDANI